MTASMARNSAPRRLGAGKDDGTHGTDMVEHGLRLTCDADPWCGVSSLFIQVQDESDILTRISKTNDVKTSG